MVSNFGKSAMLMLGGLALAIAGCEESGETFSSGDADQATAGNDNDVSGIGNIETATLAATGSGKKTMKYLGNSASDDDRGGWFNETQGIANGDPAYGYPYWYLSKNIDSNRNTYIYRVNYNQHLGHNFSYDKRKIRLPGGSEVCEHVGDIDFHVHKGVGYIAAAYDNCGDNKGRLAFFRASDINGASATLNPRSVLIVNALQGKHAPWVSVRNDGRVYSSYGGGSDKLSNIFEYRISWDDVAAGVANLTASSTRTITMRDQAGNAIGVVHKQGADFSTDGTKFYISNGANGATSTHYVRVFDTTRSSTSWYLLDKSSRSSMPFKYQTSGNDEEPEGLSYFDVNDISNYHADMKRGELFVILLNNNLSDDSIWLKHYTRICNDGGNYISIGTVDYCVACGPCDSNEGDCDSDSECNGERVCVRDIGDEYGWHYSMDVCMLPEGDDDYCLEHGPCVSGEGDCDHDDECLGSRTCHFNVGADFGYPSWVDVCY